MEGRVRIRKQSLLMGVLKYGRSRENLQTVEDRHSQVRKVARESANGRR